MALTSLSLSLDSEYYSRFEQDHDTITVTVTPGGSGFAGEGVDLQIFKARYNRDVSVAIKRITLSGNPTDTTTFYLPDIIEGSKFYSKVRRGKYFIKAASVPNPVITAVSSDFDIVMITADRMKKEYLFGIQNFSFDKLDVHNQPQVITGVTVTGFSKNHPEGWFPLTYSQVVDNTPMVPVTLRFLSWCGGPEIPIVSGITKYTLRKDASSDYIDISVSLGALPNVSVSEDLLVEKSKYLDNTIKTSLDKAISWVEDVAVSAYLEPTRIATEFDPSAVTYGANTDIPTLVDYDVDKRVDALTFYRSSAGHWMNIRFPYFPMIKVESLYGKVANTRIVDIALEWVEIHEKTAWTELVPFNQEVAFNFIGLIWVETLRGPVPIPNFWNFNAIVGHRKLPDVVLELIAKKAAVDILTELGLAFRNGIASSSISRDGISESVSYLTMQQFGVYTSAINSYKLWIDQNLPLIKGDLRGPAMMVV